MAAAAAPPAVETEPETARDKRGPLTKLTRRIGMVGLIGLPVLVLGLAGLVAGMNYDVWFAHQPGETIGPNQLNAMIGAVVVLGAGVFLTMVGLLRARAPSPARTTELEPPTPAPEAPTLVDAPAPAPTRVVIPEPTYEPPIFAEPAPEAIAPPAVARAPPAVAALAAPPAPAPPPPMEEELEEEEEGQIDLAPAPAQAARAPPAAPLPPAPPFITAAAPAPPEAPAERDELEDLFGELESEVAKAETDDVHYECPNCHGLVGEDDTTCPHCGVTFEG